MAANQAIVDELQTPKAWGLNSVIRAYINPGGVPKDSALNEIEANTILLNQEDVAVYKEVFNTSDFWDIFSDASKAAVLTGLNTSPRDKFVSFVVPILSNRSIRNPELVLRSALSEIFPGEAGEERAIKANYEALIQHQQSIAQIMKVSVRAGDVEQAMFQLGWII